MLPVIDRHSSRRGCGEPLGALAKLSQNILLRSGRAAIRLALSQIECSDGARVLLPAYHCASMVDPVVQAGAEPDFYRLTPELYPDLSDLATKWQGASAIVCTHFLGRVHDLSEIRSQCDRHGVDLIEDCAHAPFGAVGEFGDYVVSSLRKFYPIFDGATLGSSRRDLSSIEPRRSTLHYQLKALKNSIELSRCHGRLTWRRPPIPGAGKSDNGSPGGSGESWTDPRFDEHFFSAAASSLTRWYLRRVDVGAMIGARKANFARLIDALDSLRHIRPWIRRLPNGAVPYVVPVILERPDSDFVSLKKLGMPIWRWDHLLADCCPVSNDYRLSLLQLPCHQGLRESEVERMIDWLVEVDSR